MKIDPDLKQFATARQAEILDAMEKHGSIRKAAAALGISKSTVDSAYERVKALAARKGHAPGHWTGGIAPGYTMGKVTVQRGPEGVERTWERQHPDRANIEQTIRELVANLLGEKLAPITPPPRHVEADMLAVYAFGDPHFGMRASIAETGEAFDLLMNKREPAIKVLIDPEFKDAQAPVRLHYPVQPVARVAAAA